MRLRANLGIAAAVLALAAPTCAAELESGVPVGGSIGAFNVTKCGGAEDGVEIGKSLCYV